MAKHTVLVVDDEAKMQRILEIMLRDMGLDVLKAGDGGEALAVTERDAVDLVITDMRMPVMDGLELVKALHAKGYPAPVIVITAHGTIESAVSAMKLGAVDYILRPFEVETVEIAVRRALSLGRVHRENRYLRAAEGADWQEFVGDSPPMRELMRMIEQVGPTDLPVLIAGETGTGKELVARAIHRLSGRAGLFVPLNCAGIPDTLLESELFGHVRGAFTGAQAERAGKFEISDGGTLFLDEVTEMPIELQTRLLRVLQERCIERIGSNRRIDLDLRVIAATNRDPKAAVAERRLREDVYYRLNGFRIDVPPLRARGADIETLAEHFLAVHAQRQGREVPVLDDPCRRLLRGYPWPGNVRELENLMGRVVLLDSTVGAARVLARELGEPAAPGAAAAPVPDEADLRLEPRVDALERSLITRALDRAEGNKAKAARLLEISERTLWYKLKKLDLN
ncbi:MAG: sigma-54-dependent transcriptional regulator [Gammaproteobacteria bacterium]